MLLERAIEAGADELSLVGGQNEFLRPRHLLRAERLRVVVLPRLGAPLLGMDVMGRLRWQQRDGVLSIHTEASP